MIAHSQGTVIAFDALRHELWERVKDRAASLTVLTFGSPVTHIYQRYFSRPYPAIANTPNLAKLAAEPGLKWFNVYRIDGFVGTYVGASVPVPVERPMPPGGRTHYWQQDGR